MHPAILSAMVLGLAGGVIPEPASHPSYRERREAEQSDDDALYHLTKAEAKRARKAAKRARVGGQR